MKRLVLTLVTFILVSALAASFVSVGLVDAFPRARPSYPLMSFNPTFSSNVMSFPNRAYSAFGTQTNNGSAVDFNNATKATFDNPTISTTRQFNVSGFDATKLQTTTDTKVDLRVTMYRAAAATATFAIKYHSGIWIMFPNANGNTNTWTTSVPATHWQAVKEPRPDDGTTYISSSTSGQIDLFALPDGIVPTGTSISKVKVYVRANGGGTGRSIQIGVRSGGTNYWGTAFLPSNGVWTTYQNVWTTNPNGGAAWTPAAIDALEIGVQNAAAKSVQVTQVYAEVEATGSSVGTALVATKLVQNLKTYTYRGLTVKSASGLQIRFEILQTAALEAKPVDIYEVWVTQSIDTSKTYPTPPGSYDTFLPGTNFDAIIRVSEISGATYPAGFGGYQFKLWYNSTLLWCTGYTYLDIADGTGTWMPDASEWYSEISNEKEPGLGMINLVATLASTPVSPLTGSGDVVSIHFNVRTKGQTALYFSYTDLTTWGTPSTNIPHEAYDGYYDYSPSNPSTSTPIVASTFSPSSPAINQLITFKAQANVTSSPSANTASGVTVNNPTNAYDWIFATKADFTRDADGYWELSSFSSPMIPSGFSILRVDLNVKFDADVSSTADPDLYRVYYLVTGSATEKTLVPWTNDATLLANYTYYDLTETNDGAWSAADISNLKLRFGTDVVGTADGEAVNVYEVWATVTMVGSYARSPWIIPIPTGQGRGYLRYYYWDFGDGNTTTVADPIIIHKYAAANTYTVNLTVTDRYGLATYYTFNVVVGGIVPEFPLGAPMLIALAIVIAYVWMRGRRKTDTIQPYAK